MLCRFLWPLTNTWTLGLVGSMRTGTRKDSSLSQSSLCLRLVSLNCKKMLCLVELLNKIFRFLRWMPNDAEPKNMRKNIEGQCANLLSSSQIHQSVSPNIARTWLCGEQKRKSSRGQRYKGDNINREYIMLLWKCSWWWWWWWWWSLSHSWWWSLSHSWWWPLSHSWWWWFVVTCKGETLPNQDPCQDHRHVPHPPRSP